MGAQRRAVGDAGGDDRRDRARDRIGADFAEQHVHGQAGARRAERQRRRAQLARRIVGGEQLAERAQQAAAEMQVGVVAELVGVVGRQRRQQPLQQAQRVGGGRGVEHLQRDRVERRAGGDERSDAGDRLGGASCRVAGAGIGDEREAAAESRERRDDAGDAVGLALDAVLVAGAGAAGVAAAEREVPVAGRGGRVA